MKTKLALLTFLFFPILALAAWNQPVKTTGVLVTSATNPNQADQTNSLVLTPTSAQGNPISAPGWTVGESSTSGVLASFSGGTLVVSGTGNSILLGSGTLTISGSGATWAVNAGSALVALTATNALELGGTLASNFALTTGSYPALYSGTSGVALQLSGLLPGSQVSGTVPAATTSGSLTGIVSAAQLTGTIPASQVSGTIPYTGGTSNASLALTSGSGTVTLTGTGTLPLHVSGAVLSTQGGNILDSGTTGYLYSNSLFQVGPTLMAYAGKSGTTSTELGSSYWHITGLGGMSFDGGTITSTGFGSMNVAGDLSGASLEIQGNTVVNVFKQWTGQPLNANQINGTAVIQDSGNLSPPNLPTNEGPVIYTNTTSKYVYYKPFQSGSNGWYVISTGTVQ